jgi:hypothetical protein
MHYDYIIIGSNPSGLTLAYYLSKLNKSVLLVDGSQSINYNKKINYLYTHDANIYSDSFVNLINLLKEFDSNFNDLFIPMKFNSYNFFNFKNNIFFGKFILLLINEKISSLSLKEFIEEKKMSINIVDHINLICKIMLCKDYTNTSIKEFLNLLNKELSYNFYQPKEPLYLYNKLYNIWFKNIYNTKNCKILLDSTIGKIKSKNNIAETIQINNEIFSANNFIYCIDEKNTNSISLTFHWNTKIDLPNIWKLPESEWELFYIVQSDYTYFNDYRSQTVIVVKINNIYTKSLHINKNAKECNKHELINETFRQLKEVFINLPNPTDISMINNNNNLKYKNYKNVFIINNNDSYDYIEKSIIKSKNLIHKLEKDTINNIKIYKPDNIIDIIKFILLINFFLFSYYTHIKLQKNI